MMNQRMTVVIKSCDGYADLWAPESSFLRRYWPDCPYEIVLVTETKPLPADTVYSRVICTNDNGWSSSVLYALDQIDTPYVMLLLEDLWPDALIDTSAIERCLDIMEDNAVGFMQTEAHRFRAEPHPADGNYSVVPVGAPYRINASPGIWNIAFLRTILRTGETAWDFERLGSYRKESETMTVLCTNKPLFSYIQSCTGPGAVIGGKLTPDAVAFARNNGVSLDLNCRPVQTRYDRIKKLFKNKIYDLCPKLILAVQNLLKK